MTSNSVEIKLKHRQQISTKQRKPHTMPIAGKR